MLWLKFSAILTFFLILIINIIQLILSYDLFLISNDYSYLFENSIVISRYHRKNSNIYWFVFSTLLSFLLFTLVLVYYMYFYAKIFLNFLKQRTKKRLYEVFFLDEIFQFNLYDFALLAMNTSFNMILGLHLILEIYSKDIGINEQGKIFVLFSTQILLISLRYPLLFQPIDKIVVHNLVKHGKDDVYDKITKKLIQENTEDNVIDDEEIELNSLF
jgi:hypothetical protein